MNGADEKPWVWVMGEHKDDLPYDKLVSSFCTCKIIIDIYQLWCQVQQREKEKKEQERRSEIIEAENLAKQELSLIRKYISFAVG